MVMNKETFLSHIPNNGKALIYGSGKWGQFCFDQIQTHKSEVEIVGFVDTYKIGKLRGLKIFNPNEVLPDGITIYDEGPA